MTLSNRNVMMIKAYNIRVQVPTNHTPIVGTHPIGAHEVTAQTFMEGLKLNRVTEVGANFSPVEK